ncbi:MAG: Gfo/Idh/MocA family oxidoreductase [Spirochaetota bacterium]|nr:Gfo/Idh/MocA family oxidoreductase [Spirochaetota bacterium]
MSIRYALIGCGRIAPNHLPSALGCGMQIVALCDTNAQAIDALLEGLKLSNLSVKRYSDYRQMLACESLDMVAVATDSGSHAGIAKECLSCGIAVLVEKPMALSLADADEMLALSQKNSVLLGVCQQNRFNDASLLVRKALDSGGFGRLSHVSVQVRWWRDADYYAQDAWRGTWEKDGGALMNQCIHGLDLMRWFGGSHIETVSATLANRYHPYLEVEDVGIGFVRFADGAIGSFEGTTNLYKENLEERITLIGENGTVVLGGECAQKIEVWDFSDSAIQALGDEADLSEQSSVYGSSHSRVYADFAHALLCGGQPTVDGRCGRDALELVLAAYKSHLVNAPVSLPLYGFDTQVMHL